MTLFSLKYYGIIASIKFGSHGWLFQFFPLLVYFFLGALCHENFQICRMTTVGIKIYCSPTIHFVVSDHTEGCVRIFSTHTIYLSNSDSDLQT